METDDVGRYVIEPNESAAITVEQVEDEITVAIASVVGVDFAASSGSGALSLWRLGRGRGECRAPIDEK